MKTIQAFGEHWIMHKEYKKSEDEKKELKEQNQRNWTNNVSLQNKCYELELENITISKKNEKLKEEIRDLQKQLISAQRWIIELTRDKDKDGTNEKTFDLGNPDFCNGHVCYSS